MKLLREYIRELVVEQDAGISAEQEQAAATIYYVRSYAYTMLSHFNNAMNRVDRLPDLVNEFGEEALDSLDEAIFSIYDTLSSANKQGEFKRSMRGHGKVGDLSTRNREIAIQHGRTAFEEDPMNALLELIDMISNENLETGMSLEEAMRVMDVKVEIRPAVQKLDQLIKTDNDVIGILDALAVM